ncbi:LuxR C-terminal-related transcriptional regulator [Kineosporia mesophila]|uniref:LuxR C-terminal-related transcriptional regulator n=1 Tax=Kineosporia mesophila TaxID=566012 RepID=A0ABP7ABE7_9ACTN
MSAAVRELVPFDGSAWFGVDPATVLPAAPIRIENVAHEFCAVHWQREIREQDVLQYRDLARSTVPAGSLLMTTDGRPARSLRYREFLAPQSYGDEMRAALRVGGRTWGLIDLYRDNGRKAFSQKEIDTIRDVSPIIATALRSVLVRRHRGPVPAATGTALFDRDGHLLTYDEHAATWFRQVAGERWKDLTFAMTGVDGVLRHAVAVQDGRAAGASVVRLRSRTTWVTVTASVLASGDGSPGPVAVSVTPSRPAEIAPLLIEAYGLTAREQEITRAVVRGLSNSQIAATLHVSPHTVRDHLKAVFAKLGVRSRAELSTTLYGDLYEPPLWESGAPVTHTQY